MSSDNYFGPQLPGIFDFTILFEQSILSLLPTALFIVLSPLRVVRLLGHETRVRSGPLLWSKLVIVALYFCLQATLIALWSLPSTPKTNVSIAEAVLGLLDAVAIAALSYAEHAKSIKPSALLNSYLLLTIVLDIALTRTFWLRPDFHGIAGVFTTSLALKAVLLVLEETPKRLIVGEKATPQETAAGVVSRSVFWWLNTLFFAGARTLLTIDDIGVIENKFDSQTLMSRLEKRWDQDSKKGNWSLIKSVFLTFKWQFFAGVLPRLLLIGFTFAQPFLINAVVDYVGESGAEHSSKVAGGLMGATVLVYVGLAVSTAWYKHMTFQLLTMYRGSLTSLVFKKTLGLHPASIKESAPVTLMSTDVETIVAAGDSLHDLWAAFLELPIGIYLLYRHVGIPSLFILIPGIVTTVVGGVISPAMGPARVKWNKAIQERVGTTSSMLSQIKAIKMMGLSDFFHTLVQKLRVDELKLSIKFRWLLVHMNILAMFSEQFTPIIVILAAIFWTKADEGLTVAEAFTSLSIISIASAPLLRILVSSMQLFGAIGCFTRLQAFLKLEDKRDTRDVLQSPARSSSSSLKLCPPAAPTAPQMGTDIELRSSSPPAIRRADLATSLVPAVAIENATFTIGEDVDVLSDIDITVYQGTVSMVVGRVGCGKSSLLRAVAGELPMKGGRIVTSSSSLAYCDQTPWLQNITIRDNIIGQSPLDEQWLASVLRACALDEDIAAFPQRDLAIVGSGGVALSGGQKQRVALARAVYSRQSLLVLDDPFSGLDSTTSRVVFQRLFGPEGLLRRGNTTAILSTNHVNFLPASDHITILEKGRITKNQVSYDSVEPSVWGVIESDSDGSDADSQNDGEGVVAKPDEPTTEATNTASKAEADLSRQTGDTDCYKIYFRSMGWVVVTVVLASTVVYVGLQKMPQIWLRLWTEKGTGSGDLAYMGGYISFALGSILFGTIDAGYYIIIGVPKSSNRLHNMLLKSVMRAPLYFFTTTDSGMTLNRFSQDMTLIDNALPLAFFGTLAMAFRALAETGIIASGSTYVGAFIPVCFVALYFVQKYYLRTSRQMRFLDLELKTPLYTQFSETLAGLSTIRAFGWSAAFLRDNHRRLDTSQRPFYTLFCIQRWLQVVLDLFVAGMALVLVAFAVSITGSTSKGAVGLAMVNLIGFNQTLTHVIDEWTKLETSLGAIARLKWFMNNTPDENREEEKETPAVDWPATGAIELQDVTASYSNEMEPVLHNVSLKIEPGQKVGICGRSGSGKSSLILAMARLLELRSGTIRIDDVDLSTTPRQRTRAALTTLPQDPLQLSGTVRYNLDPESLVQADEPLVSVLRRTAVWPAVEPRGGLDAPLDELGLSAGQLQLFCLARALLSRGRVVLLDEATSSVDRRTDEEVRAAVAGDMAGRTVVEVAHRLEVVRECDVVVVMAEGRVQEVGGPEELLAREGSAFKILWESQGL